MSIASCMKGRILLKSPLDSFRYKQLERGTGISLILVKHHCIFYDGPDETPFIHTHVCQKNAYA